MKNLLALSLFLSPITTILFNYTFALPPQSNDVLEVMPLHVFSVVKQIVDSLIRQGYWSVL